MKITCHVPVEQYGFVAVEIEAKNEAGIPENARIIYDEIANAFKPKPINAGVPDNVNGAPVLGR